VEVLSINGHVSVRVYAFSDAKNINILKKCYPRKEIVAWRTNTQTVIGIQYSSNAWKL